MLRISDLAQEFTKDKRKNNRDQGWLPEVDELRLRESLAAQMGGGAAAAAIGHKAAYAERMALELRLPPVRLVDGTGGGGSVSGFGKRGVSHRNQQVK